MPASNSDRPSTGGGAFAPRLLCRRELWLAAALVFGARPAPSRVVLQRARIKAGTAGCLGHITVATRAQEAMRNDPRLAIRDQEIVCLICGRAFRQLTNTHLRSHGLSAEEYRETFGYNRGTALMAQELRAFYRDRAVQIRLAARIRENPLRRDPGLCVQGPRRAIRLEEQLNRREAARPAARLREARFREAGSHPRTKPLDLSLLHALRLAGLSVRQIARRLGVSPATISARLDLPPLRPVVVDK